MKLVGRFTCGACKMSCSIDRFEVAGRRFPFGGRCSLFENVWKRKSRTVAAPDLVEQRAELLFSHARAAESDTAGPRLGIPRALTTHSLFPLYSTFFSELGMEVVLSDVDPRGELKSYSGFCFPAQIAHGAVLDLAEQRRRPGLPPARHAHAPGQPLPGFLFVPDHPGRPLFPGQGLSRRPLPFALAGFHQAATRPARRSWRWPSGSWAAARALAEQAWAAAVRAQTEAERALRELGQRALARAVATGSRRSCSPAAATTPSRRRPRNPWARSSPAWA